MSGTQQQPGTPAPTRPGSTLSEAAASIEAILDRESGTPDAPTRPTVPRREPAPRASEDAAPSEAETDPRETLAEVDDGEIDDVISPDEIEEDGADEATDEADDAEEATPAPRMLTVKIDGKSVQLPEAEVVSGYLRQSDYTKKTMANAEERRALQVEAQVLRTERAQYAELLPKLHEQYKALTELPEPDWPALMQHDPVEYARQREIWDDLGRKKQAAQQEGLRLWQLGEEQRRRDRAELLVRERELIKERVPAWADDTRWKQVTQMARKYAEELGYTEEQIREVVDHRAVLVLFQAARYAQLAKRGLAVPNPPRREASPSPEPGPHPTRRRLSAHTQAKQRFAKSHSVADAATVIRGLL
jgi:hypothetical protein